MKIKELFETQEDKLSAWDETNGLLASGTKRSVYNDANRLIDAATGAVDHNIHYLSIRSKARHQALELPFKFTHTLNQLELTGDGGVGEGYVIDDFSICPNTVRLKIGAVEIKSFKGIEKLLAIEEIQFNALTKLNNCGMLRLLKLPQLTSLTTAAGNVDELVDFHKALKIVADHLADKDIVQCQGELIDADLEEYAKL